MDALHRALDAFEHGAVRGEDVVRAERGLPLDRVLDLWSRLDPAPDATRMGLSKAPDALERLELAAELDGVMGESAWGMPIDAVADAYVLAGEPERAFELRLRALSRTPRWDGVLAARQLLRVAGDLRTRGDATRADELTERAARLDPTTRPGAPALDALDSLDDAGLIDVLLADEYGAVLLDHFAKPRRIALACVRRGQAGMGRAPLHATRKWQPYLDSVAEALRLGVGLVESPASNARLLAAIEATPDGARALAASRKRAANPYNGNENSQVRLYRELALKDDWANIALGLLSWARKSRLYVGALLAQHGDALGVAYVERAAALALELSHDGYEVGGDWALPRKVLARRAGDDTATWWNAL